MKFFLNLMMAGLTLVCSSVLLSCQQSIFYIEGLDGDTAPEVIEDAHLDILNDNLSDTVPEGDTDAISNLQIVTTSLPDGNVGNSYSATLEARGGNPPYTWSITGSLPDGLSPNSGTGEISGTPTDAGTFNFTATATDGASNTDSEPLSITITSGVGVTGGYAIIVSPTTAGDWSEVVSNLQVKYPDSRVFECTDPNDIKDDLAAYAPAYVCVIHTPPVPRSFVQSFIGYIRSLDDDPYEDAVWAILTGYNIEDAKRISSAPPLTVTNGCSHITIGWLDWFDAGVAWSETEKYAKYIKTPGNPVQKVTGPGDTTNDIVTELNMNDKHCMSSSGHASEHDWSMGYSYSNGIMYSSGGHVYGLDLGGTVYNITTTNPKIYYSPGNCFIAHQSDMDCMSLAWMHSGVNAFFGHVITQDRNCCAWGIADFFFTLQDRFTYAEAIYLSRQAAMANPHDWSRCLGGTVLYGDPGWDCRMKNGATTPRYEQTLNVVDTGVDALEITFSITMNYDSSLGRTESAAAFLPQRIKNPAVVSCDAEGYAIADNFVIIRQSGTLSSGATKTIVFNAEKM